ncbi:hypothetical protein PT974_06533 [Cladobotryum mycophilum]|uniref:CENP-V/GFA domain-containing protein n=1 Tax=Cladobotryum mycophilum TaxID=491253 RepID=A0ABR0SMX7_9HYPO
MSTNPKIQCQCGAVSFHAVLPKPLEVVVCHCRECQKQSASAFGISAVFPLEGMLPFPEHVQPNIGLWKRPTDSGNTLECYFCNTCGVRVLHRSILPDGRPLPTVRIKGGCLEGLSLDTAKHIYTRSALVPVPENSDLGSPQGN